MGAYRKSFCWIDSWQYIAHAGSIRSFIRTQLLCRLQQGHQYQIEFFVRSVHFVFDSIGVYFSPDDFLYDKRYFKNITPQLWSKDGLDSNKYDPIVLAESSFHLYSDRRHEQYITIGNFKRGEYAKMEHAEFEDNLYFFLDDVSLDPKRYPSNNFVWISKTVEENNLQSK